MHIYYSLRYSKCPPLISQVNDIQSLRKMLIVNASMDVLEKNNNNYAMLRIHF